MSTQFQLTDGGHVSLACGRADHGETIRLDVVDEAGQHAFVFLHPDQAAAIGWELLRRAGPGAREAGYAP